MNIRFLLHYSFQDEWEQSIADVDRNHCVGMLSQPPHPPVRKFFIHATSLDDLQRRLKKKFLGKSFYISKEVHYGAKEFGFRTRWNSEWAEQTAYWPYHSRIVTACNEVEIIPITSIIPDITKCTKWLGDPVSYERLALFNRTCRISPGLYVSLPEFYAFTDTEFRRSFWADIVRRVAKWDSLDMLVRTGRFAADFEPDLWNYIPVELSSVRKTMARMIQESGATNKNELYGMVLDRANRVWWKMSDYSVQERLEFVFAFYVLFTSVKFPFYSMMQDTIEREFIQNRIQRVHTS